MTNTFEIAGDDLMCTRFEGQAVEWKLAERFGGQFEFEEIDFLNDIHETNLITPELLEEAHSVISKVSV